MMICIFWDQLIDEEVVLLVVDEFAFMSLGTMVPFMSCSFVGWAVDALFNLAFG